MNIENRLKRMETKIIKPNSDYCDCQSGEGEVKFNICLPDDPPLPDNCDKCGKKLETLNFTFEFNTNAEIKG